MTWAYHLALGTLFGFILSRSGAADYNYIQAMFRFESFQLFGIIGTAVAVTAPGLWLLKRRRRSLTITAKPVHPGNIVGGVLFGIGWSITGMCPGPILVNVGEGKVYALFALFGTLLGAGAFAGLYAALRRPLRLPEIKLGTGDG